MAYNHTSAKLYIPDHLGELKNMIEIVVSKESFESTDPYALIQSNIDFVNALFENNLKADEVSQDALRSYYIDYYLVQVNNDGFSQFVYNSRWNALAIELVRSGLRLANAQKNLELFEKSAKILDTFTKDQLNKFMWGEYWGENEERDILNAFDDKFYALQNDESILHLNHSWLKGYENLSVVDEDGWHEKIKQAAAKISNQEERAQAALEAEPQYAKQIRALCQASNQEFERITAGDFNHEFQGQKIMAWHFITDQGHHYMLELNNEAIMFNGTSNEIVAKITL